MEIGPELWSREVDLDLTQGKVHQHERYFLVHLAAFAPAVRNTSPEPIEEHRWWTLSDLLGTTEVIYPEGLAAGISDIVRRRVGRGG